MTNREAQERAARLGLSTWITNVVAAGDSSETITMKRVGFQSIDFHLGEADSWDEAFRQATRIIFAA